MASISLNKFIADSGYCSRQQADVLIAEERVEVNGKIATKATKYKADDEVAVDAVIIKIHAEDEITVLAFNKPRGFTSSNNVKDKFSIMHHLKHHKRLLKVNNLDKDTHGLILLTDNGNLANRLNKLTRGIEKEYWVSTAKPIDKNQIRIISAGMRLEGQWFTPTKVKQLANKKLSITIDKECTRLIEKLVYIAENRVADAQCVKFMNVFLSTMALGKYRKLSTLELDGLKKKIEQSDALLAEEKRVAKDIKYQKKMGALNKNDDDDDDDDNYEFEPESIHKNGTYIKKGGKAKGLNGRTKKDAPSKDKNSGAKKSVIKKSDAPASRTKTVSGRGTASSNAGRGNAPAKPSRAGAASKPSRSAAAKPSRSGTSGKPKRGRR
jgi:23S rRNA pseudouridine2604 synthase